MLNQLREIIVLLGGSVRRINKMQLARCNIETDLCQVSVPYVWWPIDCYSQHQEFTQIKYEVKCDDAEQITLVFSYTYGDEDGWNLETIDCSRLNSVTQFGKFPKPDFRRLATQNTKSHHCCGLLVKLLPKTSYWELKTSYHIFCTARTLHICENWAPQYLFFFFFFSPTRFRSSFGAEVLICIHVIIVALPYKIQTYLNFYNSQNYKSNWDL